MFWLLRCVTVVWFHECVVRVIADYTSPRVRVFDMPVAWLINDTKSIEILLVKIPVKFPKIHATSNFFGCYAIHRYAARFSRQTVQIYQSSVSHWMPIVCAGLAMGDIERETEFFPSRWPNDPDWMIPHYPSANGCLNKDRCVNAHEKIILLLFNFR